MIEIAKHQEWRAARIIANMAKKGEIQPLHWLKIPNAVIKKYYMTINKENRKNKHAQL
ncbi:hypothetical protein [Fastidiosibacter lacustris]|uniref:hypothetical protein n=1 Tax=Fastidiosibacter lacustris TaxID=2056695 RepID=UPI001300B451|nr:hypothetical protein [Fastidiosibacter lacustris]